jgi:cell division protein FtsB
LAGALIGDQLMAQDRRQDIQQSQISRNQAEIDRMRREIERLRRENERLRER